MANRPDGNLGLGNRYRLNDASFYLYHLREMEGAEKVANLFPDTRDSFRRAVDAAADANRLSARTDWTSVRSRIHDGPVVPPTDGRRYWFGIARGLRKAKQLMIDLDSDHSSHFGWPIYWTKWRAFIFSDQDSVKFDDEFHPRKRGDVSDYTFMSVADAKALVEKDFSRYDHIGEVADLPVWEAGVCIIKTHNFLYTRC